MIDPYAHAAEAVVPAVPAPRAQAGSAPGRYDSLGRLGNAAWSERSVVTCSQDAAGMGSSS